MKRLLAIALIACSIVIASPLAGHAQPGPVGKTATTVVGAGLTKDNFVKAARDAGLNVINVIDSNGCTVVAGTIGINGWTYTLELELSPGGHGYWLRAGLGNVPSTASTDALRRLLAMNRAMPGRFFQIAEPSGRLELAQPQRSGDIAHLGRTIADFCTTIRNTHPLWAPEALGGTPLAKLD